MGRDVSVTAAVSMGSALLETAPVSLVPSLTFLCFWAFGGRSSTVLAWSGAHAARAAARA